jgi:glycosyltransferase involved in cell wall biosynthesis
VAEYVEREALAHAVAHPIYRQNDKLERWHLERLLLLFKGFECLNGAHSPLHREAFEPLLDRLDEAEIYRLERRHGLRARWDHPHVKARTGGSDDHGLLNVGRTWTCFPPEVMTKEQVLDCLREGRCGPGGEAGSSLKLAHTFYGIAVRYYGRHICAPDAKPNLPAALLQTLVGERAAPGRADLLKMLAAGQWRKLMDGLVPPLLRRGGAEAGIPGVRDMFIASARTRIAEHPGLLETLKEGLPPLGDHEEIFAFVSDVNRDVTESIAAAISQSIDRASFAGLFNSISAILAQQFVLLPYYFAHFHQHKERRLLRSLTGQDKPVTAETLKVGLFTDTLDEVNGVSRFLRDMAGRARCGGRQLVIHTCCEKPSTELDNRVNFIPLLSRQLPYYEDLTLTLPPVLEVLEHAERQQFDAIHVSTPGPMGLCGYLVSKMLRVPLLGTYHTDFPAYAEHLTGDHRIARGAQLYTQWFYQRCSRVFARSREYRASLLGLGVPGRRLALLRPAVDTLTFNPSRADAELFGRLGVSQRFRLVYAGRVSVEKNLSVLAGAFRLLCGRRRDVALVVAGDGPHRAALQEQLRGAPVYFRGVLGDAELAALYASSDLLLFPSRTDTLGQVVLEAQACGLPVVVSDEGGPKEAIDPGVTGLMLPATDPAVWAEAIESLLNDEARRQAMSRGAAQRAVRCGLDDMFEGFWSDHLAAVREDQEPAGTSVAEMNGAPSPDAGSMTNAG